MPGCTGNLDVKATLRALGAGLLQRGALTEEELHAPIEVTTGTEKGTLRHLAWHCVGVRSIWAQQEVDPFDLEEDLELCECVVFELPSTWRTGLRRVVAERSLTPRILLEHAPHVLETSFVREWQRGLHWGAEPGEHLPVGTLQTSRARRELEELTHQLLDGLGGDRDVWWELRLRSGMPRTWKETLAPEYGPSIVEPVTRAILEAYCVRDLATSDPTWCVPGSVRTYLALQHWEFEPNLWRGRADEKVVETAFKLHDPASATFGSLERAFDAARAIERR